MDLELVRKYKHESGDGQEVQIWIWRSSGSTTMGLEMVRKYKHESGAGQEVQT